MNKLLQEFISIELFFLILFSCSIYDKGVGITGNYVSDSYIYINYFKNEIWFKEKILNIIDDSKIYLQYELTEKEYKIIVLNKEKTKSIILEQGTLKIESSMERITLIPDNDIYEDIKKRFIEYDILDENHIIIKEKDGYIFTSYKEFTRYNQF